MDFNVYLAEKLVEMRIAEALAAAERGRLLASAGAQGARRRVALGSVLIGAVNMRMQSARLLSLAVKWLVLLVTIAMVLDHLGIGRTILFLAFGILFGGVVLAAALALGLGAKDAVARALERQVREPPPAEDKVDHV